MSRRAPRRVEQEMSFREAAQRLQRRDSRGRGLKAMVLARERRTGKQIAIRLGGEKEPKMRITLGALFRNFPELRPARVDDIARLVKPMLERAEARTRVVVREEIKATVESRLANVERKCGIVRRR